MMRQSLPYTIRPMEPGDVPTVAAIERLSFPTPWPASAFLHELSHGTRSFYYVLLKPGASEAVSSGRGWRRWLRGVIGLPGESRVIGYMGFRLKSAETAHISTIAVHPDWRGRGLGELLLLTAIESILELGISKVSLEVRASNKVAQNLYRKYGFRFRGVRRLYYRDGEDAWLMGVEVSGDAYRARLTGLRQALEVRLHRQQRQTDVGQNDGDRL
ncbi:MAG: ribosomal-protein-alanine N-acetyltransferase [Chloroflexota bacterium]|mgnify:CR=1 FL=1|nr:MAG: ribosomal-protein-alanine N-acetyltransferase [Chloroflexota bacterium]